MKITIKEKKKEYDINIESDEKTVEDLKNEIHKAENINTASVTLLYNSKILSNEKKLNFYNIKDGSKLFLIKQDNKIKHDNNPIPAANTENNKEKFDSKIENLVKMGYEKEKAEKAIIQTEGDVNKAINILLEEKNKNNKNNINDNSNFLNNIKNKIEDVKQNIGHENSLPKELKKYAIYMKIATLNDPNKMNDILQDIKDGNPALLELIKINKEGFEKFLSSPITWEDLEIYNKNFKNDKELFKTEKDESKIGKVEINLNMKETEDINKLKNLGYKIEEIIEAYLLKNGNYQETEKYLKKNVNNNMNQSIK